MKSRDYDFRRNEKLKKKKNLHCAQLERREKLFEHFGSAETYLFAYNRIKTLQKKKKLENIECLERADIM